MLATIRHCWMYKQSVKSTFQKKISIMHSRVNFTSFNTSDNTKWAQIFWVYTANKKAFYSSNSNVPQENHISTSDLLIRSKPRAAHVIFPSHHNFITCSSSFIKHMTAGNCTYTSTGFRLAHFLPCKTCIFYFLKPSYKKIKINCINKFYIT